MTDNHRRLKTVVPFDKIAGILRDSGQGVAHIENGLAFAKGDWNTVISFEERHASTRDGKKLTGILSIKTDLGDGSDIYSDDGLLLLNPMATLGAIVKEPETGRTFIGSRLTLYEGDETRWGFLAPLAGCTALLQLDTFAAVFRQAFGIKEHTPFITLPRSAEPSLWAAADYSQAALILRDPGVFANASPEGLTAEFEWEPGAVTAIKGDRTSLLMITSDEPHPALGNGLLCRLHLPLRLPDGEALKIANDLNLFELNAADAPPLLGAWCCDTDLSGLVHVAFWPNFMHYPATILHMTQWMMKRNHIVRSYLTNPPRKVKNPSPASGP
jgi:hypothetical protein